MFVEECAVFPPCFARAFVKRLLHREKQFRGLVKGMIHPVDGERHNDKDGEADSQLYRRRSLSDDADKQPQLIPSPLCEPYESAGGMAGAGA